MLSSLTNITRIPELRRRLLVTFALLFVYRIGHFITLPGVDTKVIDDIIEQAGLGGLAGVFNFASVITGGNLRRCTLFALGIMPYISASIIFSLLIKVIPALEELSKEGESGRRKITQYTRYATVLLCVIQSFFIVTWMKASHGGQYIVPLERQTFFFFFSSVLALTTGTIFLMWLGEQITEFGIGNGISLIIMTGIISRMPGSIYRFIGTLIDAATASRERIPLEVLRFLVLILLFVGVVVAVVIMTESQRRIPIQQAKQTRGRRVYGGQRHYLPFRINSAGVMPVIFAQSLLMLPAAVFAAIGFSTFADYFTSDRGFWYILLTIILVVFFTYFWTSLTFNPVELANQMKEYGSFVPGIRPGKRTSDYIERIINRITLVGACFLATVTLFPTIVAWNIDPQMLFAQFLGGTGILIIVGVALDVVQKIESHLLMRHYEGFMKRGRIRGRRG
jgi:preprotein translocase subunit SecY